MKKITLFILSTAIALLTSRMALAQATPAAPQPPAARGPALDLALEAARAAIAACLAEGQASGVSIVDSAGVLKVLLAADGASTRGVLSSTNKALTALAFKSATSRLGEQIKTDPELAARVAANSAYNARPGGLLITVGNEVIGAIGVGGARIDEPCALAGLQKVQGRLK